MDNAEYLKQISSKNNPSGGKGSFLSPNIIKLLIGAAIALIFIIVLGVVINGSTNKTTVLYESFYLRLQNLSSESGPVATYARNLKSSDIRAAAATLKSSLSATSNSLSGVLGELNIDVAEISEEASTAEANNLSSYTSGLEDAKLNGLLDRTFLSSTMLQISMLLSMESEILEKTSSGVIIEIINKSSADLTIIQTKFAELNSSSS